MNYKSYISNRDRYEYLIDRISVRFTAFIACSTDEENWIMGRTKGKLLFGDSAIVYLTQASGGIRASVVTFDNLIERRANILRKQYPIPRGGSDWRHGENVFESYIRIQINEQYRLAQLRKRALNAFFKRTLSKRLAFSKLLSKLFRKKINPSFVTFSLADLELSWDILTNPDIDISKDPNVIERFQEIVSKNVNKSMINQVVSVPSTKLVESAESEDDEFGPSYLTGYLRDGTKLKIYKKECGKFGVINRVERTFEDREHFVKSAGRNGFSSLSDLNKLISKLAKSTFKIIRALLGNIKEAKIKEDYDRLQVFLHAYTPRHSPAIRAHLQIHKRIATGKNSSLNINAVRKVQSLRREGILFVRKKYQGRYFECINWAYLQKTPTKDRIPV